MSGRAFAGNDQAGGHGFDHLRRDQLHAGRVQRSECELHGTSSATFFEIQESTNFGIAWAAIKTAPSNYTCASGNVFYNLGDYSSVIGVAPGNPNVIYVGGYGGFQYTLNGGAAPPGCRFLRVPTAMGLTMPRTVSR